MSEILKYHELAGDKHLLALKIIKTFVVGVVLGDGDSADQAKY
jgi:hypothetical protein